MRIGSLFSGYGGLDIGTTAAIPGSSVAWHAEIDKHAAAILHHHWPDIPNHGDITKVDWDTVEPVDILTGGFPCQDVSTAGKRAGIKAGTRSGLWTIMAEAVDHLKPDLVIIENVRGLLSAEASSNVEPCPHCMGDDSGGPVLRALGAVLGDLADLGYDARWGTFRASDVGACHRRERVFIVAHPADTESPRSQGGGNVRSGSGQPAGAAGRRGDAAADATGRTRSNQGTAGLPRQPRGMGRPSTAGDASPTTDADIASRQARLNTRHHGPQLRRQSVEPAAPSADASGERHGGRENARRLGQVDAENADQTRQRQRAREIPSHRSATDWGPYADAIHRWERVLGRPAPPPTEPGTNNQPRLSPTFVEWMMGLPHGHVTHTGIPRTQQLKALGNGVVPQQAAHAITSLLGASCPNV